MPKRDNDLPASILFSDYVDPEFKEAICKVINSCTKDERPHVAVNTDTGKWKFVAVGESAPDDMDIVPRPNELFKANIHTNIYSLTSVIAAMKKLNPKKTDDEKTDNGTTDQGSVQRVDSKKRPVRRGRRKSGRKKNKV